LIEGDRWPRGYPREGSRPRPAFPPAPASTCCAPEGTRTP